MTNPVVLPQALDAVLTRRSFLETSAALAGALELANTSVTQAADETANSQASTTVPTHPLDPLAADEIVRAVEIVRHAKQVDDSWRIVTVTLAEPTKQV
jgi:Cu2+-containing amine oxidase